MKKELVWCSDSMNVGQPRVLMCFDPTTGEKITDPTEAAILSVQSFLMGQLSRHLFDLYKQGAKDICVSFLPIEKEQNLWDWQIKLRAVIEWEV